MPTRPLRNIVKSRQPLMLDIKTSVFDAALAMEGMHRAAVLVMDGDTLAGIFTERDATYRVLAKELDPKRTTLGEVMTRKPTTLPSDRPFGHALHLMYEGGFRHVIVVEDDKPIGIVSARHVLGTELMQFEDELHQREDIAEHMR